MYSHRFGLIGQSLKHSFSPSYFNEKFKVLGLVDSHYYDTIEFTKPAHVLDFMSDPMPYAACNVTNPYKELVASACDVLIGHSVAIHAVNTIVFEDGLKLGYNTDVPALVKTLFPWKNQINSAYILGTGGAAKAAARALFLLGKTYQFVSRNPTPDQISYEDLNAMDSPFKDNNLIINATPVGLFPNSDQKPHIPYSKLTKNMLMFDMIYNPEKTIFLDRGMHAGCVIKNGLEMLHFQAEFAWEIWNDKK